MVVMKTLYKRALKPILFRFDPELVHRVFVDFGEILGKFALTRGLIALPYRYRGRDISKVVDGIRYHTPVALAAGFDYNGRLTEILGSVSFGGDEIGSVTSRPCEGNPPPRLKRLIQSKSLLVSKGLRNPGVDQLIHRLQSKRRDPGFVIGVSIARTNDQQSADFREGIEDYYTSLRKLVDADVGDYYTINISCPNVHGGESFADPARLRQLLTRLREVEHDRPMYVKMPINLPWDEFEKLLEVVDEFGLDGVVIGNLNKNYYDLDFPEEAPHEYAGGLSGKPCAALSNDLIARTRATYGDRLTIIGCGGILSAEDAMDKFRAGADLVQMITGMIFEGPHLMKEICDAYAAHYASFARRNKRSRQRVEAEPALIGD